MILHGGLSIRKIKRKRRDPFSEIFDSQFGSHGLERRMRRIQANWNPTIHLGLDAGGPPTVHLSRR